MPIFAGLILSIATNFASFLGLFFAKKIAIGGAAVGTLAVLVVAVYGVLSSLLGGLGASFPSFPGSDMAIWIATPPSIAPGLTAILSADAAVALYRWNAENVKLLASAS